MYTLLRKDFQLNSLERISGLGGQFITYVPKHFMDIRMKGVMLKCFFLDTHRKIKAFGENICVVDFIWDQCRGKRGFRSYDYNKLRDELNQFTFLKDVKNYGMNTSEIIDWIKECHPNVSLHAFDAKYENFCTFIAPDTHQRISLFFICKDKHL